MLRNIVFMMGLACLLAGCMQMPVGNHNVPQPSKPVDVSRYLGHWYELARYDNWFEKGCEAVTAEYDLRPDGMIKVFNSCHEGAPAGPVKASTGKARIVEGSQNAKLEVSFFGPFYGDYWVLDHAADYSWSIVGEPSGKYLWLLHRKPGITPSERAKLYAKIKSMGYDVGLLRPTVQAP